MIDPIEIKNLSDFVKKINATQSIFQGVATPIVYWRGQLANESLLPSALRGNGTISEKSQRETRRLLRFQAAAAARGVVPSKDDSLEWLVLMQHSGLPTRLLDWSTSPLVAAFFAVEKRNDEQEEANDASIWMMDPMRMADLGKTGRMHNIRSKALQGTAEAAFNPKDMMGGKIYATAGQHTSAQHMVQHSCFTIHGNVTPLEQQERADQFLAKFIITTARKQEMRMDLARLGIQRALLFPDFTNLAREIKESDALFPARKTAHLPFTAKKHKSKRHRN